MREDCKNCPEYNPCGKEGKWCFIGALVAEVEKNKACADVVMPLTEKMCRKTCGTSPSGSTLAETCQTIRLLQVQLIGKTMFMC